MPSLLEQNLLSPEPVKKNESFFDEASGSSPYQQFTYKPGES